MTYFLLKRLYFVVTWLIKEEILKISKHPIGCNMAVDSKVGRRSYYNVKSDVWYLPSYKPYFFTIMTHEWIIFTEFYFIMLQTMTSRYIDTQLLLCVYVHLWVYVCVCVWREQWDHRKQNEKVPAWGREPPVGPQGNGSEQRDSLGADVHTHIRACTHTRKHTNRVKSLSAHVDVWDTPVLRLVCLRSQQLGVGGRRGVVKVLWVSTRKRR